MSPPPRQSAEGIAPGGFLFFGVVCIASPVETHIMRLYTYGQFL